jgi:hypothetical protein
MAEINALEILRETEKQVVLAPKHTKGKESRENKKSDWQCWFDTWEQAHDFLVSEAQKKVDSLRLELKKANGCLGNIKGMKSNV